MILQRYMGSHLEDLLENGRIKVSKANSFNDPFEYQFKIINQLKTDIILDFHKYSPSETRSKKLIIKSIQLGFTNYEDFIDDMRNHPNRHYYFQIISHMKDNYSNHVDSVRKSIYEVTKEYILCCHNDEYNPKESLMWGHYAQNNKGFRLHFDLKSISESFSRVDDVIYQTNLPEFDLSKVESYKELTEPNLDTYVTKRLIEILSTKSDSWNYEKEIRVFVLNRKTKEKKGIRYTKFNLKHLKRIDFGIRYDQRDTSIDKLAIHKLIETYRDKLSPKIVFTQAQCNPDEYKIDYHEIDIQKTIDSKEVVYTGQIL